MQLVFLVALFLIGNKIGSVRELSEQLKPVVNEYGNDEMKEAFHNAEQVSELIVAVQELQSAFSQADSTKESENNFTTDSTGDAATDSTQKNVDEKNVDKQPNACENAEEFETEGDDFPQETFNRQNDKWNQNAQTIDNTVLENNSYANPSCANPVATIAGPEIFARLSAAL